MNFFFNIHNKAKIIISIIIFFLVLIFIYFFLKEDKDNEISILKENLIQEKDSSIETETSKMFIEKKVDKEILNEELNEKKKLVKEKYKEEKIQKNIEKKKDKEKIPTKITPTQTVLKLHGGLKKIKGKNADSYSMTKKIINETFDTEKMLSMITGDVWKQNTDEEKKEVLRIFEEYVTKNYIKRFSKIKNPDFEILVEKKIGAYVMVKTHLKIGEKEKVSINYLLSSQGSQWKIFDVLLAGSISEIATKKSEFKLFLENGNINPLIEALKKKNKGLLN